MISMLKMAFCILLAYLLVKILGDWQNYLIVGWLMYLTLTKLERD